MLGVQRKIKKAVQKCVVEFVFVDFCTVSKASWVAQKKKQKNAGWARIHPFFWFGTSHWNLQKRVSKNKHPTLLLRQITKGLRSDVITHYSKPMKARPKSVNATGKARRNGHREVWRHAYYKRNWPSLFDVTFTSPPPYFTEKRGAHFYFASQYPNLLRECRFLYL